MKIGDRVLIRGTIDEIRRDIVIIKNEGGYFGTVPEEIVDKYAEQEPNVITLTQKEYSDLCIQLKGLGWKFVQEQEPTDKSNLEKICEELAAENDDLRDQLAMRDRFKQEPKVTTTSTDEPMVMQYPQVDGITPTVVKKKPTLDDLWANIKKWKEEAEQEPTNDEIQADYDRQKASGMTDEEWEYGKSEQEPTSVKHDTVPVKLRINKVSKHISNIDLDELEQEPIPEQWQELKETILEMRDNDGTGTQQEVCKFLANYMGVLEKQMVEPQESEDKE